MLTGRVPRGVRRRLFRITEAGAEKMEVGVSIFESLAEVWVRRWCGMSAVIFGRAERRKALCVWG